jgi:hypothetical protein
MLAGEFLVLGQPIKRGYLASVTLGNAKYVDILVHNLRTGRNFNVQVKAVRKRNAFPIKAASVKTDHIYVFVTLNKSDEAEQFYIVRGDKLRSDVDHFWGSGYINNQTRPAVNYGPLTPYLSNWNEFEK